MEDIEDLFLRLIPGAASCQKEELDCSNNEEGSKVKRPRIGCSKAGVAARDGADESLQDFNATVLEWYDSNRRLLPWRGDVEEGWTMEKGCKNNPVRSIAALSPDELIESKSKRRPVSPYETWVSEIMLQQTRVDTVVGYFLRWMEEFPTVERLAESTEEQVNSIWAGLGYYRRARNLHKGAKFVTDELSGTVPSDAKGLLDICGIGAYTAGAIGSIAFNKRVPLVDGNVIRVFARLCAIDAEAKDTGLIKACWRLAERIVPHERPGDFNQALMELGATVCAPSAPKCESCPVKAWCKGFASGNPKDFPRKKTPKKKVPEHEFAVAVVGRPRVKVQVKEEVRNSSASKKRARAKVVEDDDVNDLEYLVVKRPPNGLLAGQWEFVCLGLENAAQASEVEFIEHLDQLDICHDCFKLSQRKFRGTFKHVFSHLKHNLHVTSIQVSSSACCLACTTIKKNRSSKERRWMTTKELKDVGLTKSMQICLDKCSNSLSMSH